MLVYPEIEHQVKSLAVGEVMLVVARDNVRLAEQDRVAAAPLDDLPKFTQVLKVQLRCAAVRLRFFDDEWNSVDTKPGNAEPHPVADDAVDFCAYARVLHVQVGLKVVEAVEVPQPRLLFIRPR